MRRTSKAKDEKKRIGMTLRARFTKGVLTPTEKLPLNEGDEVTITVVSSHGRAPADWLERTAGGWAGLIDAEELKRHIYSSRLITTRTEPSL